MLPDLLTLWPALVIAGLLCVAAVRVGSGPLGFPTLIALYLGVIAVASHPILGISKSLLPTTVGLLSLSCFVAGLTVKVFTRRVSTPGTTSRVQGGWVVARRPFALAIVTVVFIAVLVQGYRFFKMGGVPLMEGTWYTEGLRASSGLYGQLLQSVGVDALLVTGLVGLVESLRQRSRSLIGVTVLCLSGYFILRTLQGGKAVAIVPVVSLLMCVHYMRGRVNTAAIAGGLTLAAGLMLLIGSVRIGSFSLVAIVELFAERLTRLATEHYIFIIEELGPLHALTIRGLGTLELEGARLASHFLGTDAPPLYNQAIQSIKAGAGATTTGLVSVEPTMPGTLYANGGVLAVVLGSFLFGVLGNWLDRVLSNMHVHSSVVVLVVITGAVEILGVMRSGNVLIGLESWLLRVTPAIVMLAIGTCIWSLFNGGIAANRAHWSGRGSHQGWAVEHRST